MSQPSDRAKSRLDNLNAVEPLLGALRTISMSTWQKAQNKIGKMKQPERHYHQLLNVILPEIQQARGLQSKKPKNVRPEVDTILLIIGSERGLCGKFNENLVDHAIRWIAEQDFTSHELWAMGSRMALALDRKGLSYAQLHLLSASDLTSYQQTYLLSQQWLAAFESYQFNHITVLYNQSVRIGKLEFSTYPLLPYKIEPLSQPLSDLPERWPPPIIETEPEGIYRQIVQHTLAASLYKILLRSSIAEHSTRFRMMEEAKQNAEELITELERVINAERKRKITQQMQELAVSAGLVDNK